jgi:hypothetical protein
MSSTSPYSNVNKYIGWILLGIGCIMLLVSILTLVFWEWMWMTHMTVPVPLPLYGEDIEDLEPGILTTSSTKSFLSGQNSTNLTNREADKAILDLENTRNEIEELQNN